MPGSVRFCGMLRVLGVVWLAISVLVLAGGSAVSTALLSRSRADRPWVFLALATVAITAACLLASAFQSLNPYGFLGAQAAVQVAICLLSFQFRTSEPAEAPERQPWRVTEAAALIIVIAALALSAWHQAISPLAGFDERMYHASRVLYWLDHESIFPYRTHNERQIAFPWLAESFFMWPLLFVKQEWVARMFFWTALPLGAWGVASLGRACGLSRAAAVSGAAVYSTTPTILLHACAMKADMWLPVFLLGTAYFAVRAIQTGRLVRPWFAAGLFAALAISVKTTALAIVPGVLLVALVGAGLRDAVRRWVAVAAGATTGIVLSGLLVLMALNLARGTGPLGSGPLVRIVQPEEYSARQVLTHLARACLILFEIPEAPSEAVRVGIEERGRDIAQWIGADQRLPLEQPRIWPGVFEFESPPMAKRFSIGGIFWLPCLCIALCAAVAQVIRTWPHPTLRQVPVLAVIQLPLLLGVVVCIRWMGGGPERFWIGAYALSIPVTARCLEYASRRRPLIGGLVTVIVAIAVLSPIRHEGYRIDTEIRVPRSPRILDEPFAEAMPFIPPGSTILLFGADGTRDYPLFAPRSGYPNRVVSWGKAPFSAEEANEMLERHGITHIVIESDPAAALVGGWPMISAWLDRRPDFSPLSLDPTPCRLFGRERTAAASSAPHPGGP